MLVTLQIYIINIGIYIVSSLFIRFEYYFSLERKAYPAIAINKKRLSLPRYPLLDNRPLKTLTYGKIREYHA